MADKVNLQGFVWHRHDEAVLVTAGRPRIQPQDRDDVVLNA